MLTILSPSAVGGSGVAPAIDSSIANRITSHPFFRGMKPGHLELLAGCAMPARFKAGEVLFKEGDPANRFYIIESGAVIIESVATETGNFQLGTVGAGEVLGWSWLFPPYYWHFDARAAEDTTAIFFYGTRLREMCETDTGLGYELMKRMAGVVIQRLQTTRRHLAKLA